MNSEARPTRLPAAATVSTLLVAIGVLCWLFVSRGLLAVAALGAFGPGLLRELGWLRDHDEFQRRAAHRAGYHAYLAGGTVALLVLAAVEWGAGSVDESAEWIRLIVVVLWLTWLSSTLVSYWGARKTATVVLSAFGAFWAVFVGATLLGESGGPESASQRLLGIGAGLLVVAPFFVLAWTAKRWPRVTGVALLLSASVLLFVFGGRGGLAWSTVILTDTLLVGPLLVTGLALLLASHVVDDTE